MPSTATWETIESAILTWIQSFKTTMDEISDIQLREDDEPELNSKTSQFSNPPNYKVYASNASISQDGSDKSNAHDDGTSNSKRSSSINAFTSLPGYTQNQADYQRVPLLCTFWDGYACSYKGSNNKPCNRRHQPGIDQRPWAKNDTSMVQMNTHSPEWLEYLEFQCTKRQEMSSTDK